jgi:PHD/YefM family antitoxin component YafN of YafNO toxin-antitoxin module
MPQVQPDVVYTSAAEWPSLQEARRLRRLNRELSRECDDAWGGKVWDGVTDWFVGS